MDFEIKDGCLVKYTGEDTEVVVPDGVTSIGEDAFEWCSSLTSVTIPDSVTSIGESAFSCCWSLTSVTIPDGVTSIGYEAFRVCSSLTSVMIPDSVTNIGDGAFYGCENLKSVTIPNGVTSIERNIFCGCSGLTSVKIPDSVTSIGESAFRECSSLTSVTIPDSVTSIGYEAFGECSSLTSVTIPSSVTSIGKSAFSGCSSLTSVTIPDSVTSIGEGAFCGCDGMADDSGLVIIRGVLHHCKRDVTSVTIPDGVTSIRGSAFRWCSSLTSVTIPAGVTSIEESAFEGCDSLTSVTIPNGVKSIGSDTFKDCSSLTSVTIPNSVTSIGFSAFSGCRSLTNIVIPDTVQELSHGVFYGCSNLQTIRMSYDLLKTHPFCPSSKTITLELTKAGEVVETVPAVYRKDYPSVSNWIHNDDCLVPIGKDEISYFDNLIAAGTYDGFTINENGRVAAILWRLNKKDVPIKEEILSVIREFLIGKLSKTIKYAMQENPLEHIRNLISIGVISSENEQQVVKLLKKSTDEDVRKISAMLGQLIAENKPAHLDDEKPFPLDDRFKEAYMAASVYPKMLKLGIEIPELKAADGNGYAPKECIQLFIAMYMDADEVIPLADEAAQMIERDTLNAVLLKNYEKQATIKDKLSLLNAVMRFADGDTVRKVFKEISDRHYTIEAEKALCLNDSRAAMLIAERNQCLAQYARLRGMDEETFRDTVLANFDLDNDGTKKYDLGGTVIVAALKKDMTIELFDTKQNKVVKSIPKKGNDEALVAAATKDFSDLKKNIKKVVKSRFTRLFEDFREGTKQTADRWKAVYLSNPVLRQAANLVVWKQGTATFILREDQPILADGRAYVISDKPIYVAHPMEMKPKDVAAWQTYFLDNDLKQPFEQIWEPVIQPEDVRSDRYEGAAIPYFRFLNAEKHGIDVRDEDFHNEITITFEDCDADVERLDWSRHEISPNDRFEVKTFKFKKYTRQVNHIVAYLDKATVYDRITKDDVSVTQYLHNFTAAQIVEFITLATENKAVNVAAALLEYKQQHFGDVDSLAEYTLDW